MGGVCNAYKSRGGLCKMKSHNGLCYLHRLKKYPVNSQCKAIMKNGLQCSFKCTEGEHCSFHPPTTYCTYKLVNKCWNISESGTRFCSVHQDPSKNTDVSGVDGNYCWHSYMDKCEHTDGGVRCNLITKLNSAYCIVHCKK